MSSFKLNTSMFMQPLHLPPSAWIGHIPFAAWLVEELKPKVLVELGTHNGASYLAFCQAVKENALDTKCYAVDTWQGDEQAGLYGEEVFETLNEIHRNHYAGFSQMLRMTFDEAAGYFADGSVDLLHIDGLHTYEAVSHDFATWLPKLSERGVILFHDTMVRERDFGVWKFWDALSREYPSFEFQHAYGLGVLLVGKDIPKEVAELANLRDSPERITTLELLKSLADRIDGLARAESVSFSVRERERNLFEQQLKGYQAQVAELNMQLGRADAYAKVQIAHTEQVSAQLSERLKQVDELQRQFEELLRDTESAKKRSQTLQDQLQQRADREEFLTAAIDKTDRRIARTEQSKRELEALVERRDTELKATREALGRLQTREIEMSELIDSANETIAALHGTLKMREEVLQGALREREEVLQGMLREREDAIANYESEFRLIQQSRSWRWTAPLRGLTSLLRGTR
jgi:hypothetical protein